MPEDRSTYGDEIDLLDLLEVLWDGKWKIIATTFVAALIGVVFSVVKPNSFQVSTPVQTAKFSVFLPYISLNNLLKEKGFNFDNEINASGYKFDDETIFATFVVEFNDYEEMVDVLSEVEFVKQSTKDLNDKDKQRALIGFAKKFKIIPPSKNENKWFLKFEWHDDYEGRRLFDDAIQKVLFNIQKISENNVEELAKLIEIQNLVQLETLQNELSLIKLNQKTEQRKRIHYLTEQSAIATELGIDINKLDAVSLNQSSQKAIKLNINASEGLYTGDILYDPSYYMRGYKAINKEIALLNSRSDEEVLLMADSYVELSGKITSIKNDLSSSQLKNAAKLIQSDNSGNWIEFDLELADAKSQKKSKLYVALSIVVGGIIGIALVLIRNANRKRKEKIN
jgi:LPS O-antigen subunit length determinant protein (WzzB/FepE family)